MGAWQRTRTKWQLAGAIGIVLLLLAVGQHQTRFVDTEETLWPDPRDRQMVHLGALSRRLQGWARDHDSLPESPSTLGYPLNRADEWGTAILYQRSGPVLLLRSAGPDRRFGTSDDITLRDGTTYESKRALYLAMQDSARKAR